MSKIGFVIGVAVFRFLALFGLMLWVGACAPVSGRSGGPSTATSNSPQMVNEQYVRNKAQNFVSVLSRIEPAAEQYCASRTRSANCDFQFLVDDRPNQPANAYQTLDESGRPVIGFTLPLIFATQNNDELAFVAAHEAAHHILGHIQQQSRNATVGAIVLGGLVGASGRADAQMINEAQRIGAALGARTYSKEFELEADSLGAKIAMRAGFDPTRGAAFFFRLPDPGDRFLGTHPPNADRIKAVQQAVREF